MGKNEYKNCTVSEIKAMLASGAVALQDLDTATLQRLADYETDMLCFGEGDVDLIGKCADILCERETDMMSHEDFMAVVNRTLDKQTAPKRFGLKRCLIIAAAVAAFVISGTVVASAFGFNLFNYIGKMVSQPVGTQVEEGDYTFYKPGEVRKYTTIKEATEKENLNIMYPASLPEGVTVKTVRVTKSNRGDKSVDIFTNDGSISIGVETGVKPTDGAFDSGNIYTQDGIDYIIYKPTTYKYGANAYVDGCEYCIQADKYEDLIYIIENMKENEK